MVSSALRVLVVEDDELMLELYRCQFDIWALPVACSLMSSAAEVLQGIDQLRPDLLITDLSMPGMDGQQMLREIEGRPLHTAMQIVVVSGLLTEQINARGGLSARMEVLKKPVDFAWLKRRVTELVLARQG
jgi:CheY-like chemotaxis protein